VVFTVGSLLCGLANGPLFLSLARAGQGIGGAILFATSLALLSEAFRGRDRGVAFGVFGAVTGVAVAVGPVADPGRLPVRDRAAHLQKPRADRGAVRGLELLDPGLVRLPHWRAVSELTASSESAGSEWLLGGVGRIPD
jgi:Major Facilitator Superfamily